MKKALLIWPLFIGLLWGQDKGIGTSTMPIFKVGFGPRTAAMGGAFIGLSDDIGGMWINPAGMAQRDMGDALLAHHQWFQDIRDEYVGVLYPWGRKNTIGGGLCFSSDGGFEHWSSSNDSLDPFIISHSSGVLFLSFARRIIAEHLFVGAGLRGVYQSYPGQDYEGTLFGFGGGVDAGVLLKPFPFLGLGASLTNAGAVFYPGGDKGTYNLPTAIRVGGAFNYSTPMFSLNLLSDVEELILERITPIVHMGLEVMPNLAPEAPTVAIRLGYQTGPVSSEVLENEQDNKWKRGLIALTGVGITAGLGVKWQQYRVEYAFAPYGVLGTTHRIAFGLEFGKRPLPGALIVKVIDGADKKPLEADLDITGVYNRKVSTEPATGKFFVYGLPSGPVKIRASKKGYYPGTDSTRIVAPDTAEKVIVLWSVPPGDIIGKIYDVKTKEPLAATVEFSGKRSGKVEAKSDGNYKTEKVPSGEYHLVVTPVDKHYFPQEATVSVEAGKTTRKDFALLREKEVIVLKNIYFETSKANLLPESYPTLDYIGKILIENPDIVVELSGHTDIRPIRTREFPSNLELSQARAEAVKDYLVKKFKIDPKRLVAKGYGPYYPIASSLTEEGMYKNRRTEFKVLSGVKYYQEIKRK